MLARYIQASELTDGLHFFSKNEEPIQVGSWKYEKGTRLAAHIHNHVERTIPHTCEVLYIISGKIQADIYSPGHEQVKQLTIQAGDVLILLAGGHGYTILEPETKVLEIKNGPYPGADIDRYRI